jgi:hypothetical protein
LVSIQTNVCPVYAIRKYNGQCGATWSMFKSSGSCQGYDFSFINANNTSRSSCCRYGSGLQPAGQIVKTITYTDDMGAPTVANFPWANSSSTSDG